MAKVDLAAAFARIDEPWSPRIVARYNGERVFLAKAKGEFRHSHPETADLFLVLEGKLTIDLPDQSVAPNTDDPATAAHEVEL